MGSREKNGKRRQITFRIGPIVQERLAQVAELFNLKPSEYVKALLYKDLGIFNEPLDQRRRTSSRHGVSTWEANQDEGDDYLVPNKNRMLKQRFSPE